MPRASAETARTCPRPSSSDSTENTGRPSAAFGPSAEATRIVTSASACANTSGSMSASAAGVVSVAMTSRSGSPPSAACRARTARIVPPSGSDRHPGSGSASSARRISSGAPSPPRPSERASVTLAIGSSVPSMCRQLSRARSKAVRPARSEGDGPGRSAADRSPPVDCMLGEASRTKAQRPPALPVPPAPPSRGPASASTASATAARRSARSPTRFSHTRPRAAAWAPAANRAVGNSTVRARRRPNRCTSSGIARSTRPVRMARSVKVIVLSARRLRSRLSSRVRLAR